MPGFLHSKKFLGFAIFFVLLLIIVPVVFILVTRFPTKPTAKSQNPGQETQTSAVFEPNTELASFNGTPIYVKDLNALALEQYKVSDTKTLTANNLYNLLNIYVERKILDSQNLGDITTQIAQVEKTMGLSGDQAKYEALREKLTTTRTKNWSVYTIDFWLPPTNADGSLTKDAAPVDPSQTDADRKKLVSDVNSALDYAQQQMQNGVSAFNVATQINNNYPSIADLLGLNANSFRNSTNPSDWSTPKIYYYDKTNANDPFYKTLYAMTDTSPVTKVLNSDNMGGSVIKIIKVNNLNGILDNYENWLKGQESNFTITNAALKNVKQAI